MIQEQINNSEGDKAKFPPPDANWQKIAESFEAEPGYKPKVTIAAKDDRVLPKNFMPDDGKEEEYLQRAGKPLQAVLYKRETREKIKLPAKIGVIYRQLIRSSKVGCEGRENKDIRDKRAEEIQEFLMKSALVGLNPEDRKKLQTGDWSVRSETTQVEYERLIGMFRELEQSEDSGENKKEEIVKEAPALVSFKQVDINKLKSRILEAGIEVTKTKQEKNSSSQVTPSIGLNFLESRPLNRLQKLRLNIGRTISRGEGFDKVASEYAELREYMHWYLTRRLAAIDLFERYERGEIQNMPENILSVASGPFAETETQAAFTESYESLGLKQPRVTNLDKSDAMLVLGRNEVGEADAVKANMCRLPFKEKSFDFTENTSLHLLLKKATKENGEALQALTLAEMVRVTRENGLIRIIYIEKPPEYLYGMLQQYGLELLTPQNSHFDVSGETKEILAEMVPGKEGRLLAERAATKAGKDFYILARKIKDGAGIATETIETNTMTMASKSRGERVNWKRVGADLSGEDLRKELQRREKEFEIVIRNNDMNEAKNLFWEFGRAGREANIASGDVDIESAESLPTSILLKRAGSRKFKNILDVWRRKIWSKKPRHRKESASTEIPEYIPEETKQ